MIYICRHCEKPYSESQRTADFRGYCSLKCQHAMSKRLGYVAKNYKSGVFETSEFGILSLAGETGHKEVSNANIA